MLRSNRESAAAATPNAVTTGLSADGKFDIANGIGTVDVVVDVVGYYTDHNHDDRYYTEAEIDLKTMFAVVNVDGTLRRGSSGVTSQQFAGGLTGDYQVTFPRSIASCGVVASPSAGLEGNNPFGGEIGTSLQPATPSTLYVQGKSSAGVNSEVPFTVIVACP